MNDLVIIPAMPLSRFETAAQQLLEGSFKRLFGGYVEPQEVAARLARAMEDGAINGRSPDEFTVSLHPRDYAYLYQQPDLEAGLATVITRLAGQTGLILEQRPLIHINPSDDMKRHHLRVTAVFQTEIDAPTELQPPASAQDAITAAVAAMEAYLVIDGRKTILLEKPIIALGRRSENDIVLDTSTVSRQHAQLRWRYGRFILYDLNGRGQTAVNGQQVHEWPLQSGDIINISGHTLIYGEGNTRQTPMVNAAPSPDKTQLFPAL